MNWDPHHYQIRCCNLLLEKRNWALFLDPGMGKTSIVLKALSQIKQCAGKKKTLVIGPLRVITTSWPDELAKWEDFANLKAEVFHGRDPEEIRNSDADIILVNFDYLKKMNAICLKKTPGVFGKYATNLASFYGLNGLVVDELTAFKNTNSQRWRILSRSALGFEWRWGLTGTPVANRLSDIFGQAYILDCGNTFGKFITHFRNKYFRQSPWNKFAYEIRDDESKNAIYTGIDNIGTRLNAEDYLDLPDFIVNNVKVKMNDVQKKQYRQMQKSLVIQLNDETISATNKVAAITKCRQLASGMMYNEDTAIPFHEAKVDALEDLVEELNGKSLLVFINFRAEADMLKKRFPGSEIIYGGTSKSESDRLVAEWNKGNVSMLVVNPATMAHGMNLQAGGNHIVWYTLPWDMEHFEQGNRRLFRQGQMNGKVVCHKLLTEDTIDYYVDSVLQKKGMSQNDLFEFLRREMKGTE